ncbi:MAG: hypothetical protein U0R51_14830 [Solirubrobacterales bacterium]
MSVPPPSRSNRRPEALDLPGPSRRITVEPLRRPDPSPAPEPSEPAQPPLPVPAPGPSPEREPEREPTPA